MEALEKMEKLDKTEKIEGIETVDLVEKIDISLDNTLDEVVSYDSEGKDLYFSEESFIELPPEVVKTLSAKNRERYMITYGSVRFDREHSEDPIPKDIVISGHFATARDRLAVYNKKPGMEYSWQTPDRIRTMSYAGYKVSTDPGLDTFGRSPTGVHRIGIQGQDELVLMETTKENHDALQRASSEKSRQRKESIEAQGAAEIQRAGGIAFRPERETKADSIRRQFTDPSEE